MNEITTAIKDKNMTHELKCNDEFMMDIATGLKSFEVRQNDRGFEVGDTLLLKGGNLGGAGMTDHDLTYVYSGKVLEAEVTYILHGGKWGIQKGYCVMGIKVRNYNF